VLSRFTAALASVDSSEVILLPDCGSRATFEIRQLARVVAAVSVVGTMGMVAPPVDAATLSVFGNRVLYRAEPGEANAVYVSEYTDRFVISEDGAKIDAGTGCTELRAEDPYSPGGTSAACSRLGVTVVEIHSGDRNDGVNLSGLSTQTHVVAGAGVDNVTGGPANDRIEGGEDADRLVGGDGIDFLDGGPGDDTIYSFDPVADRVACRNGQDNVTADTTDSVSAGCNDVAVAAARPLGGIVCRPRVRRQRGYLIVRVFSGRGELALIHFAVYPRPVRSADATIRTNRNRRLTRIRRKQKATVNVRECIE
jgi:hemolysin type calcium-binding protein